MPELPEVETVCRALAPALCNQTLTALKFHRPDIRFPLPADLPLKITGQTIRTLFRRGKYIVCFAENGHGFVLHLGMSGVVRVEHDGDHSALKKHDHVEFMMGDGTRVVFNDARRFGFLEALDEESWQTYPAFAAMGPEPLGNDFNGPVLYAALSKRKTPIKSALLNQAVVAGLGNIYVCEALFYAGIHPQTIAADLNKPACERLAHAIKAVLQKALEAGGSSLKDYRHTDGNLGYFQHQFAVYDREDMPCGACECDKLESVQRIVQSGRSTFFCPAKQKMHL